MSPEESEPLALILNLKWTVPPCGEQTAQCHAGNATTMATDAEAGKRDVSQGGDLEEAFSVLHQDFAVCREEALGLAIQPPDLLSMPHLVLEVELQSPPLRPPLRGGAPQSPLEGGVLGDVGLPKARLPVADPLSASLEVGVSDGLSQLGRRQSSLIATVLQPASVFFFRGACSAQGVTAVASAVSVQKSQVRAKGVSWVGGRY